MPDELLGPEFRGFCFASLRSCHLRATRLRIGFSKPDPRTDGTTTRILAATRLEQVRDDVWALGMPMPGTHVPYSLLYILIDRSKGLHLIDPGWDSDENWRLLLSALAELCVDATGVASITVTHLPPDHVGMVNRLRDYSAAPVQLHSAELLALVQDGERRRTRSSLAGQISRWGVPDDRRAEILALATDLNADAPPVVDRSLTDAQQLAIPDFDIRAMHTPGHTRGHLTLRDDARNIIFTGDHLLPTMMGGIGLSGKTETNALEDYLSSLQSIWHHPDHEVLPGHGYRFLGLQARATQTAEHQLARAKGVATTMSNARGASTWSTAAQLTWTA